MSSSISLFDVCPKPSSYRELQRDRRWRGWLKIERDGCNSESESVGLKEERSLKSWQYCLDADRTNGCRCLGFFHCFCELMMMMIFSTVCNLEELKKSKCLCNVAKDINCL